MMQRQIKPCSSTNDSFNLCSSSWEYSELHLTAADGREDILQRLMACGSRPEFNIGTFTDGDYYIPCPLYLAAVEDQIRCMELLMALPECSILCKASCYLVQIACQVLKSLPSAATTELITSNQLDKWRYCLRLIESQSIECGINCFPVQRTVYGNRKEFTCETEIIQTMKNHNFFHVEIYLQCLLIMERCLGLHFMSPLNNDLNMSLWISNVALHLIQTMVDTKIIQFLLNRSTQAFHAVYEKKMNTGGTPAIAVLQCQYWCQTQLLENDRRHYNGFLALQLQRKSSEIIHIDFLESMMKTFDKIVLLSDEMHLKKDSIQILLKRIFYVITCWYNDVYHHAACCTFPIQLSNFCNILIEKYTNFPFRGTLLHSFLQYIAMLELSKDHEFITNLLEQFLLSGGYRMINAMDANGIRPVHYITDLNIPVDLKIKFLSISESYGAHLDSVDKNGRMILDETNLNGFFMSRRPLSLLCYCARVVVSEQIVYKQVPKHIIKLIQIHECY